MDEIRQLYNLVEHCRHKRRNDVYPLLKAIRALEKQISKKVGRWESGYACCPVCKRGTIREDKYCCFCGQKLDWGDRE